MSDQVIKIFENEFGVSYPSHTFSQWPGFSLNPGIMSVAQLKESFILYQGIEFDPKSDQYL